METFWFFDSAFAKRTVNAKNIPGSVVKDPQNPLFGEGLYASPALPWEPRIDNGYPNVFFDPSIGKYRCYYTGFAVDGVSFTTPLEQRVHEKYHPSRDRVTGIFYAESKDGYHWNKPSIGIVDFEGNKENNILALYAQGASILFDAAEKDGKKKYKLIARDDHLPSSLYVAFSADGIHFGEKTFLSLEPSLLGDTHNFVLRNPLTKQYMLYTRKFSRGIRTVARLVSDDFIHWQDCREVLRGLDADDQIYAMPVFYQENLFFGLAAIFHTGDEEKPKHDHVEVELCYSGDGIGWQRVSPGIPFIPNGEGNDGKGMYDAGCCFASTPVLDGEMYRFYYMGGNGTHYSFRETGLCTAYIPKNRLAGVTAAQTGEFVFQTCNLSLREGTVSVCADVWEQGVIRYELLDPSGNVISGYGKNDCVPLTGTCDHAPLEWQQKSIYPEHCAIRFLCEKAVLYNISGNIQLCLTHPI